MAEIKLGGGKYINFSENKKQVKAGDSWKGTYLGTTKGKYSLAHEIETADGLITLNGVAQLDKIMEKVQPNTPILVRYDGKTPSSKDPNKRVHSFYVDGTRRTEPAPSAPAAPAAAAPGFKF